MKNGFTLVELLLVIGIFAILSALTSINFFSVYSESNLAATKDILVADIKTAQSSAMAGLGDTSWDLNNTTPLPQGVIVTTSFPGNRFTFVHGSGEIMNYAVNQDTITLSSGDGQKIIRFNKYGTIIGD